MNALGMGFVVLVLMIAIRSVLKPGEGTYDFWGERPGDTDSVLRPVRRLSPYRDAAVPENLSPEALTTRELQRLVVIVTTLQAQVRTLEGERGTPSEWLQKRHAERLAALEERQEMLESRQEHQEGWASEQHGYEVYVQRKDEE